MLKFIGSTVGRKYIMGLSGLVWAGFVFAHMAGNMLIFVSDNAYNTYGHLLTSGYIIYFAEAALVLAILAHVVCAVSLMVTNKTARPQRYAVNPESQKAARFASTTMAIQGSVILAFIILHLITFKYGTVYMTTVNGQEMRDLARLMYEVFNQPAYVVGYAICLVLLGFHLRHGVSSIFQSFGLLTEAHEPKIRALGAIYAVVVAGGFLSQPIYAFLIK
ncbi:MAG: succinate dehydrogenase cytochrome b subunit [Pseudobdellovibrionaceae bacterium]